MALKTYIDQMNRKITISKPPKRIISLVPSLTELLFDLGLAHEIIGITKFCIHPATKTKFVPKIGGTKNFKFSVIQALKPDLIIGNKEENYQEGIEKLAENYAVWMSDILTLSDAYEAIVAIGKITQKEVESQKLIAEIQHHFRSIKPFKKTVLYLIWQNPYMAVGQNTFIDEMLKLCGFENTIKTSRYPEILAEEIQKLAPELILLSSEPYPFGEKHLSDLQGLSPKSNVILVDGELFSWYGSRLRFSADYFQELINKVHSNQQTN